MLKKILTNPCDYSAEFLSILDGRDGDIVRILVEGENAKFARLKVKHANIVYVGWPAGEEEFSTSKAIFSIKFKGECPGEFFVKINGDKAIRMSSNLKDQLIRIRNCTFVNPEIDPMYNIIQVKEDYSYKPFNQAQKNDLKFSIITPLYNTPIRYFNDLINTILSQKYTNFELILINSTPNNKALASAIRQINDERVRVCELPQNLGIVGNTNEGIKHVTGDYCMFVDHDDTVSPNFLSEYKKTIVEYKSCNGEFPDLLTCDEDRFEELGKRRYRPLFKHGYCEDLHMSFPYMGHCLCVKTSALKRIDLPEPEKEGAQDYDICLKVAELNRRVTNVPKIVYHWREHENSMAFGDEVKPYIKKGMESSLRDAYARRKLQVRAALTKWTYFYNPVYETNNQKFDVVFFNNHDNVEHLNEQILKFSSEKIVAINSDYFPTIEHEKLDELVAHLDKSSTAIVSPKLIYPDGQNFMCGLVVEDKKIFPLNQNFCDKKCGGYRGYAECDCDYSATSFHIFAINKSIFQQVGGFVEFDNFWLSIIDYCFKVNSLGLDVCVTPTSKFKTIGDVWWANMKDNSLITSSKDIYVTKNPGVVFGENCRNEYLGLGKLPNSIPEIKDRLYNPNVDYRLGYPQLKIETPRELYP